MRRHSILRVLGTIFMLLCLFSAKTLANTTNHWETFIFPNTTWSYFVGTSAPPADWYTSSFDDHNWMTGKGGLGYGDGDDSTVVAPCISLFIRQKFTIADTSLITEGLLSIDYDDAFIAYVNGVEIARSNILGDHPDYTTLASLDHEAKMYAGGKPESFYLQKAWLKTVLKQGDNVLAIEIHNITSSSSDMSVIPYLSFGISTSTITTTLSPSWLVKLFDSNLPILKIYTGGIVIPDNPKITATLQAIDNAGVRNSQNDPANNYNGPIGIEIRGSSSQGFTKKSYTVETRNNKGEDSTISLLGLPKESDWVLYAPYSDKTLIRNVLTYKLGNQIMGYAPRTRYCELFIDDVYNGVYVLVEKIKRGKNRVNIAKMDGTDISGDLVTGGYIYQVDRWTSDAFQSNFQTNGFAINFAHVYPKPEDMVQQQKDYIKSYTNTCENYINTTNYTGYGQYIDIPSFVDFFLICEFAKNVDAYRLSTYMHKDRNTNGGKLTMGPLWDFDLTYGNANYYHGNETFGWMFQSVDPGDGSPVPFWWSKLIQDPDFKNRLKCRWTKLRSTKLQIDSIYKLIDDNVALVNEAQDRNFTQFPILGKYIWPNNYIGATYTDEVSYMKTWIKDRLTWLDLNMPGICTEAGINEVSEWMTVSPNPFQAEVEFNLSHQKQGKIEISIYNTIGQKICVLHSYSTGNELTKIVWKGNTDNGLLVSSGVYIYTVSINGTIHNSGKLIKTN